MNPLRVGLIGLGGIGMVHHRAWQAVPEARVVGIAEPDAERAASAGLPTYPSAQALLAAAEVDAIDICTPPAQHAGAAIAALQRGLPVLCEKPLARSPEEARGMVAAAAASGTLLMTAFCHRFHPPILAARRLLQSGTLGRLLMLRNRFGAHFSGVEHRWFADREAAGGGALMDTTIHSVDLFRYLAGEIHAGAAAVATFNPTLASRPVAVEDSGILVVRGVSGTLGVLEASWMTPCSANVLELYCEQGAVFVDYNTGEARYRLAAAGEWQPLDTTAYEQDRFAAEVRHFAAAARGEAVPLVSGEDGLRAVEVIHAAYATPI